MTWNPRRKNPLSQRPSPAQPLLTQAEDRDLDIAVQRLIQYVESTVIRAMRSCISLSVLGRVQDTIRRLTKETKRYLEAIANLDRADQRLSTNLSTCGLAHMSDEFRRIVEEYHSITTQVGKTVQELTALLQKTFVEPLKKLLDEFVLIAAAVARREELVIAWRSSYNRVKKLQEKRDRSASHVAKLEREKRLEESAGKELRAMHTRLLVELPWFLDKRLEYIKPSVHALIMIQMDYYGNATRLFTQLMPVQVTSDSPSRATMPEEEFQALVNGQINRIKSLTIVKDH